MADITMPQLGETVTEGTITRWLKQPGEQVAVDELLFEVSTDKVDSEVPSPVSGVLSEILVPEGETVAVGTKLAVVSEDGEAPAPAPAPEAEAEAAPAQEDAAARAGEGSTGESETATPESGVAETGAGEAAPEPASAPVAAPAPASGDGRTDGQAAPAPAATPAAPPSGGGSGKVLSPVVRRLIAEHNLDPGQIQGTGAGGRITREDVLDLIDKGAGKAQPAAPAAAPAPAQAAPAPSPRPAPVAARAGDADEMIPFSNIRRRTAEHMVRSKATSPHVLIVMEVDYAAVDKVRQAERERFKADEGFSLTYLPFVCRAVVDALEEYPLINSSVGEDSLIVHRQVNLGIAVDLDFEGLIVPVVHDVPSKRLRAIAREISDLANRARRKKLTADDISGGTFTITNPGPFGTLITAAVINQPQVAILSTDGVRKRPVAVTLPDGSDGIAVHPVGHLALTFDHRAFDGAYASAFLNEIRTVLETRDWAQEL